jgi:hypothetical protein
MKNLLVANVLPKSKKNFSLQRTYTTLKAQIENICEVGWELNDILLLTNFPFSYMGVKAIETKLNDYCLTGSKLWGIKYVFENGLNNGETVFSHDCDVWQNVWFDEPLIKDIGISTYASSKLNGGVVFWKNTSIDILESIMQQITQKDTKEEPTINKILGSHKDRFTILNTSFNVGCSGYVPRILKAIKPVKNVHMNPYNRISWETHRLDRDGIGISSVGTRLEKLFRKYFVLAEELSKEGQIRQKELKKHHEKRMKKYIRNG